VYHTSGNLPKHQYVWTDLSLVSLASGWSPAVWFGISSIPGRVWGCHLLLESGAVYRNVPPHGISFSPNPPEWSPKDAQLWDCYSSKFSVLEYDYLAGMRCQTIPEGRLGRYLFTVVPYGEGFSEYPEQSKEFFFVQLDTGRLVILPTNRLLFRDQSFTRNVSIPLKVSDTIWRCE
jgi:hypothetical protein